MRPKFREQLETYGKIAKDEFRPEKTEVEEERLRHVLGWHLEESAKERGMDPEHQRRIYELQKEKQRIMRWLRDRLAKIDEPEGERSPDTRRIIRQNDRYVWQRPDGTVQEVTLGAVLTDGEWGVRYALDPDTVPRTIRKRALVERAKERLREYQNQQIAIDRGESRWTGKGPRGKYREYLQGTQEQLGHVAERIVRTFLRKTAIDFDLDFEVVDATIDQDAEFTIDFLIRVRQRSRGVRVDEAPDTAKELVGIQLSTAKRRPGKAKKIGAAKERLEAEGTDQPIQDIVLVRIKRGYIKRMMDAWNASDKPPGGPEQFLDPDSKERMFRALLQGVFTPEELEAQWNLVHQQP